MLRFVKIFFGFIAVILLILILSVGGLWWKYRIFVDAPRIDIPENIRSEFPLSSKVNPFIGTGGVPWTCAYNFPGPSLPFGVMRLSPETASMLTNDLALNTSGYFYGDNKIIGFSHTRLVGTGATDGGHFLVLPIKDFSPSGTVPDMLKYKYSHKDECAYPGYYSIDFPKQGFKAELTATERTGIHRYTFGQNVQPGILLNITHAIGGKRSEEGFIQLLNDREIVGHVRTYGSFAGRYGGIKVYFAARLSEPVVDHHIWENGNYLRASNDASGDKLICVLEFDRPVIELKLAISHVSIENAWENLESETREKDFDAIALEAIGTWENRLSTIKVNGGTNAQQVNFYTALYRSFQMPTVFSDVNGEYKGFDKEIHRADSFRYFTDMSIWDTFRTTHPLYNLIARKDQRDMVVSLVKMAKQGGWLPRWPSGYGYTNSMLGSASDIVISEAYQKGIRDFDVEFAFQNMKKIALASTPKGAAFSGRRGNDDCVRYGWCPADSMSQAVSRTLEYAWSDYSIGLLAKALGKSEDAALFHGLSMNYKNVWNPETQYFHPRNADGQFVEDFKPLLLTYVDNHGKYTDDYVEGSAMQWRWAPFFDAPGLIGLFTDKVYFIDELNNFFIKSDQNIGHWYPGSYYWHGNEPDIHAPYLFNYAGRPDLTQKWMRWVLEHKYSNRYDGIDGNDDGGTLSAWYVFSALGFYPVAGTDVYQLGAPLFESASIQLDSASLQVVTVNYGPENIYVNNVWLNNILLDRTWIRHDEIKDGGILKFEMSSVPKK
jgi:predicted alpha-1,2-mannosidase